MSAPVVCLSYLAKEETLWLAKLTKSRLTPEYRVEIYATITGSVLSVLDFFLVMKQIA